MLIRIVLIAFLGLQLFTFDATSGTVVQFRTTLGDFEVELYDKDKPVTVQNFLRYITNNLYANSFFHRGVGNFVIQGGGFWVSNRVDLTNFSLYSIPTFSPITNEFKVGPFYSNVYGTIAMAKTSDPDSATSQFFINLVNNSSSLDDTNNSGGFTVFGKVIGNTNVLNRLNPAHATAGLFIVNAGGVFGQLPVLNSFDFPSIESDEFVYVDISLLSVHVRKLSGSSCEISWNSISNRVNVVEYTTNLPPVWLQLATTNGNGSRLAVQDITSNPKRFYRVRVNY